MINNWEFKFLGHVKYLRANLSTEPVFPSSSVTIS